ncbi:sensor histidine kinase [Actinocorallia populi]|uniref:sensor histidine kinase n=1 Tax=Actinocorallia populi TaxID=2079200 RepID=UPI000D09683E|nr:ATP-binding protein [Actinocorallia populi]
MRVSVRTRLTLLHAVLFTVSGAVLLGILYLLVLRSRRPFRILLNRPPAELEPFPTLPSLPSIAAQQAEHDAQRQEELTQLLTQSGIALAITAVLSLVLSWVLAGRILRPLRAMTATVQRISARNLHERLAADGPADELKDLSDTIDGLLVRLEAALDAHKRFVANAAHELRTPLTLEHALIEETLLDREAGVPEFRASFERVLEICRQQGRLLESLLTLTTGERGLDRKEPVDLADRAERALLPARLEAERRGLRLDARLAAAPVSGDPELVERLVANLLDNAVAYNVPDGRVRITTGTRDGRALVTVVNTGAPVPPDRVGLLFEPFQRLDRARGRDGHHGLGLSIVRAIAAAHDATAAARARPDGGLSVEVSFPATPPASRPSWSA